MESVHYQDTLTVFMSGVISDSYSLDATESDNYSIDDTIDGLSVTITGDDSLSYHYSGGTGIVFASQTDNSESVKLEISGTDANGGQIDVTSEETVGYHETVGSDPSNPSNSTTTASWTDQGSDSYGYTGSGSYGGATYTVSNLEKDTFDNSGTATSNASGLTRNTEGSGTTENDFHLTVSGINDATGGAGSDSLQEDDTVTGTTTNSEDTDSSGTILHSSRTADFSHSTTGSVSSNPFRTTESGWNSLIDGSFSSSPSNLVQTGSPPTVYLAGAQTGVSDLAYMSAHFAYGSAVGAAGSDPIAFNSPWGSGSGPQGANQARSTAGTSSPTAATNTLRGDAFSAAQPDEGDDPPQTTAERLGYAAGGAAGGAAGLAFGVLVGAIPIVGPYAGVVAGIAGVGIGVRVGGAIGQSLGGWLFD
jgi:hypothetical protein